MNMVFKLGEGGREEDIESLVTNYLASLNMFFLLLFKSIYLGERERERERERENVSNQRGRGKGRESSSIPLSVEPSGLDPTTHEITT